MSINTYSPSDVIVSLAGLHTVTGFADGTFVEIRKLGKPFETQRAMDGEISRIYHEDKGFEVRITLMQSSSSNNILSMLYNVDKATRIGKFPMVIKDGRGSTAFVSLTSWIEEIPDVKFASALSTYTWTFGCADATISIGGNDSTSMVEDALMLGTAALPLLTQYF